MSDIHFSDNITLKGRNVVGDPQNHFLNWGRKLDGQKNNQLVVKFSDIDGDQYFGEHNLSG